MENSNKKPESGLNIDKIVTFCKANVKYISAGVLTVALIAVLAVTAANKLGGEKKPYEKIGTEEEDKKKDTEKKEDEDPEADKESAADADSEKENAASSSNPEVVKLISTYYNSYAAGDLDKLSEVTKHLSDMEKDYIKMMNEHVEAYNNVSCTVVDGKTKGSYIVSAVYDMKFAGVGETLPGMNVFYVQKDKKGNLYINNVYSSFNRELEEQKTKKNIITLIEEFEKSDTVKKLHDEVQDKYDEIIGNNEELQKKADEVADAIAQWKDSYDPTKNEEEKEQPEEEKPKEEPAENTDDGAEDQNNDGSSEDGSQDQNTDDGSNDGAADDGSDSDGSSDGDGGSSGLNYVPEGKVLTANDGYNVRVSMNESAELVGTTAIGDSIKVILSYAEGWTKVEWNGTTGYIRTDLLLAN